MDAHGLRRRVAARRLRTHVLGRRRNHACRIEALDIPSLIDSGNYVSGAVSVISVAVEIEGLQWVRGDEEPVDGTATVDLRNWEDLALDNRERFAADLRAMGVPDSVISNGLALRDTAATSVAKAVDAFWQHHPYRYRTTPPEVEREVALLYDSARRNAWARLHDWWVGRATEVESRDPLTLRLPLFLLSAPAPKGCLAEFSTANKQENKMGWSLKLAGTGLGSEGRIAVSTVATFEAGNGQRKLIFLPVTVILETIVSAERGSLPGYWQGSILLACATSTLRQDRFFLQLTLCLL